LKETFGQCDEGFQSWEWPLSAIQDVAIDYGYAQQANEYTQQANGSVQQANEYAQQAQAIAQQANGYGEQAHCDREQANG
jgi:hypothetical protein